MLGFKLSHVSKRGHWCHYFVTRAHPGDRNCLFCHVYDNTSCFKIADGVTRTIFVAAVSSHGWQLYCILRPSLKTRLSVTKSVRFVPPKWCKYCSSVIKRCRDTEISMFYLSSFLWRPFWELSQARECIPWFSCKKIDSYSRHREILEK